MPALLDTFPYPWSLPAARELHMALVTMYPQERGALFAAESVGLPSYQLTLGQPVFFLWKEILDLGAGALLNRKLVQSVLDLNKTHARASVLRAFLADQTPALDPAPRAADGTPVFVSGTDLVTVEEALLFADDLTVLVGSIPGLVQTLQRMVALAPGVCRLKVKAGALTAAGTGFRIADDLLLTNHHVLFPFGARASSVTAEFGYETDANETELTPTPIPCDVATIVSDPADDWAVLRVTTTLNTAWPTFALTGTPEPVDGDRAFILQHPRGDRKRLGFVRNTIVAHTDRVVHYLTDTEQGSSGSPVLDAEGRLLALHHAGGTPQEVAGKLPLTRNEGIRISRVHAGLVQRGLLPA